MLSIASPSSLNAGQSALFQGDDQKIRPARRDQWERVKDSVPERQSHVGMTARDNRLFVEAVLYRYRAGRAGVCLARFARALRRLSHGAPASLALE